MKRASSSAQKALVPTGDVIKICSGAGIVVAEYKYDAWGNVISITGTLASTVGNANPFRYRGYYYDTETGLYYLQSRYYDPQVGRFLNADVSINANGDITGFNMFAYCSDNPVMFSDPSGTIIEANMVSTADNGRAVSNESKKKNKFIKPSIAPEEITINSDYYKFLNFYYEHYGKQFDFEDYTEVKIEFTYTKVSWGEAIIYDTIMASIGLLVGAAITGAGGGPVLATGVPTAAGIIYSASGDPFTSAGTYDTILVTLTRYDMYNVPVKSMGHVMIYDWRPFEHRKEYEFIMSNGAIGHDFVGEYDQYRCYIGMGGH